MGGGPYSHPTTLLETTGSEIDLSDSNVLFATLQSHAQYFDMRTASYINTVIGPLFGVESFWYRQEFAKSSGMIHWHGLCWRGDREPLSLLHEAFESGLTDNCAQILSNWAKSEFGMTAMHPAGLNEDGTSRKDLWPEQTNLLLKLLMDVSEIQGSLSLDK